MHNIATCYEDIVSSLQKYKVKIMIDKLYIIRPSFSKEINWERARKDWSKAHTTVYDNKAIWDEVHTYPEVNRVIEERIDEAYKEWSQTNRGTREEFLEQKYKTETNSKGKPFSRKDWLTSEEQVAVFKKVIEVSQDDYVIKAAKTELEFNDWIKEHRDEYLEEVKSTHGTKGNNNIIFDTIWAVLTSDEAADQIFVPGNFDAPKKWGYMTAVAETTKMSWKEIEEIYDRAEKAGKSGTDALKNLMSKGANLGFVQTHLKFHQQNMVAGKLIGIFALNNISHCIIGMEENAAIAVPSEITLQINDEPIGKDGVAAWDSLYGRDGKKISSTLAELLAASVDAVKDPVLNYLNINQDTANVLCTLIRLGYGLELASRLLSNPFIKGLITTAHSEGISVRKAAFTRLKELGADASQQPSISIEYLKGLREARYTAYDEVNVISAFLQLSDLAKANQDVLALTRFNSVSAAVGPQIADTRQLKQKVIDALYSPYLNTPSMQKAINHPIIKAFRETSLALADTVFQNVLIQASPTMELLNDKLNNLMPFYMTDNDKIRLTKAFHTFYMAWLLKQHEDTAAFKSDNVPNAGDFNRNFAILSKIDVIVEKAKKEHPKNVFIKALQIKPRSESNVFPQVTLNTRGMKSDQLDTMAMAWASLLEEAPSLALGLAEYEFIKGGLGFRPDGLTEVMPIKVKREIPNYISTLQDTAGNITDKEELITQFIRNNWNVKGLIPVVASDNVVGKTADTVYVKDEVRPIIRQGDSLYVLQDINEKYSAYKRTTPLGGNSEFLEIYPNEKNPKSVISDLYYAERMKKESESVADADARMMNTMVETDLTSKLIAAILLNTSKEDISNKLTSLKAAKTTESFEEALKGINIDISLDTFTSLNNMAVGTIATRLESLLGIKDIDTIHKIMQDAQITMDKLNLCGKL